MRCIICGNEHSELFCPHCGARADIDVKMRTCPKCGTSSADKYCPTCGAETELMPDLKEVQAKQTSETVAQAVQEQPQTIGQEQEQTAQRSQTPPADTGESKKGYFENKECPMCGNWYDTPFCPSCGYGEGAPQEPMQDPVVKATVEVLQNGHDPAEQPRIPVRRYDDSGELMVSPPKEKSVALLLCVFLGAIGVHRFYTGKVASGLLYLFTGGLGGLGWVLDLISIITGNFRDNQGNPLV